jgi:pimeloyl-ACP methyl ester carboxylesterase
MTQEREKYIPPDRRRGKVGNLYFEGLIPPEIKHKEIVLFIHGSGMNYRSGLPLVEFFAHPENGYRAFTFSLRGHTGSEIPQEEFAKTTMDDYLKDVRDMSNYLKQEFGIDFKDQIIIGHSMGGLLAMKHVEQHGARILILMSSALPKELIERFGPENVYPKLTPQTIEIMKKEITQGKIHHKPKERLVEYFSVLPPDFEEKFNEKYAPLLSLEAPIPRLDTYINPPSIDPEKIKCPVLVIAGSKDVIDPKFFKELANYLKGDYKEYLVGHAMMYEEKWPEIAQQMRQWIEENIK